MARRAAVDRGIRSEAAGWQGAAPAGSFRALFRGQGVEARRHTVARCSGRSDEVRLLVSSGAVLYVCGVVCRVPNHGPRGCGAFSRCAAGRNGFRAACRGFSAAQGKRQPRVVLRAAFLPLFPLFRGGPARPQVRGALLPDVPAGRHDGARRPVFRNDARPGPFRGRSYGGRCASGCVRAAGSVRCGGEVCTAALCGAAARVRILL